LPENVEDLFKAEDETQLGLSGSIARVDERSARLTIQEGKDFHIKRMFESWGGQVLGLHCERIGPVTLDADLQPGESRYLTPGEVADLVRGSEAGATVD